MRKILISLTSILVIIAGVYLINYLLNPNNLVDREQTTTRSFKDYNLFNYGDNFKTYSIENKRNIDYLINGVKITYENETLLINEHETSMVQGLYDYFATYDDSLLILAYYQGGESFIITYNYDIDDYKVLANYNNMIVDLREGLIFNDDGVIINYSYVKDNKYLKNNKNICDIENDDLTANIAVQYYYDNNEHKLGKIEEIYKLNLYTYKKKNNLCT